MTYISHNNVPSLWHYEPCCMPLLSSSSPGMKICMAFQFSAAGERKKLEVDALPTIPKPAVVFFSWVRAGQNQTTHGQPMRSSSLFKSSSVLGTSVFVISVDLNTGKGRIKEKAFFSLFPCFFPFSCCFFFPFPSFPCLLDLSLSRRFPVIFAGLIMENAMILSITSCISGPYCILSTAWTACPWYMWEDSITK